MISVCEDFVMDGAVLGTAPCWCVYMKRARHLTVSISFHFPIGDAGDGI